MKKMWLLLGEISIEMLKETFCLMSDVEVFDRCVANDFLKIIPRFDNKEAQETGRNSIYWTSINTPHAKSTFQMKSNASFLFGYIISRTIADTDATEITGVRNIKIFPKESGSKIFHTAKRSG
jgi:hypothetical protein